MRNFGIAALSLALSSAAIGPGFAQDVGVPTSSEQIRLSFSPVIEKSSPAVVDVFAHYPVEPGRRSRYPQMLNPLNPRESRTMGSGVIVDPSGVIVTNYHVIDEALSVAVGLDDGTEYQAEVLLSDEPSDLAVLRLEDAPAGLPSLAFADSDTAAIGDLVLAIGNPFGLGKTVTSGIISALPRTQLGAAERQMFLQTDAAINPGNSGGALVNLEGDLLGINSAIYSRTGGSIGIAFAVPSNLVKVFVDSAITGAEVPRPWLGAALDRVPREMAAELGMLQPQGVILNAVLPEGPMAAAGLQRGDVILGVDGHAVTDPGAFDYYVMVAGFGETVELAILRQGEEITVPVALAAPPEMAPRDEMRITGRSPFSGVTVANLSPAVAVEIDYLGRTMEGVVIVSIAANSAASRAGLHVGDVILSIDGADITVTKDLADATAVTRPAWPFVVEREGQVIQLGAPGP